MNEDRPRIDCGAPGISRRRFCTGAGASAGALAAMGSLAGLVAVPRAEAALKSRRYYAYYVALELGGKYAGLLEAAEGGEPETRTEYPEDGSRIRLGVVTNYAPVTVRLADMSPAVYDWIHKSLAGSRPLRSLSVVTASQDLKESYRLLVQDARISEVLLDDLDAATAAPARFTLRIEPGRSAHEFGRSNAFQPLALKASPLLRSNFRLYIQGFETLSPRITAVSAVSIKVDGSGTPAVTTPGPLRFQIPLPDAGPLFQWMNDSLVNPIPRAGELQLLSRDRTRRVAGFSFTHLTIMRTSGPAQAQTGEQVVEVECAISGLSFNPGELLT